MKLTYSRIFHWLFAALFLFTPLVMYHRTSELFEFNKMLTIYLITGLVLSVWIARMLMEKKKIIRLNPFIYVLGAFFFIQLLSTIFSIDVHTSIYGYYGRFNGGLLSIAAYCILFSAFVSNIPIKGTDTLRLYIEKILLVSIVSSIAVMLWGLPSKFGYDLSCYVFTGHLNVDCWTDQFKPTIRLFSTLGQPNWLGAYMAIHFFIGLYFYLTRSKNYYRYLSLAYLFSVTTCIIFTRSRSALLSVAVGGLLILWYLFLRRTSLLKSSKSYFKYLWVGLVLVVPIVLFGTGVSKVDRYIHLGRFISEKNTPAQSQPSKEVKQAGATDYGITASEDIRKIVWQGAFSLGLEYPFLGTGVETFAYSYGFLRPMQHNLTSEWDYVYNKAHNEFYNYFATTGFLGIITYLLLIAVTLIHLSYVYKGVLTPKDERLVVCLLAAYVTIIVTNFFGFSTSTIQLFFYMIPAWIMLIVYKKDYKDIDDEVVINQDYSAWLVVPGIVALSSLIFVMRYFSADIAYANGDNLTTIQRYNESIVELYNAYTIRDEHVYADKISQSLTQLAYVQSYGDPKAPPAECADRDGSIHSCVGLAKKYNEISLKSAPKNVLYYRTQARNYFYFFQISRKEEDFVQSVQALKKAQELAPTDPRYQYYRALFELGRYETIKKPTPQDTFKLKNSGLTAAQFAIKLKENYTDAYIIKGLIEKDLKDPIAARKTFEYALKNLAPGNEQIIKELEGIK